LFGKIERFRGVRKTRMDPSSSKRTCRL